MSTLSLRRVSVAVLVIGTTPVAIACGGSNGGNGGAGGAGVTSTTTQSSSSTTTTATSASTSASTSSASSTTSTGTGMSQKDPVAMITAPANGAVFAVNASFAFAGTGVDPQDGVLTGNSLVWIGDIATGPSPEGEGISGTASFGTTGPHTLTLTATDSNGNTGSAAITITIQ